MLSSEKADECRKKLVDGKKKTSLTENEEKRYNSTLGNGVSDREKSSGVAELTIRGQQETAGNGEFIYQGYLKKPMIRDEKNFLALYYLVDIFFFFWEE
jgi:hypothetical protein